MKRNQIYLGNAELDGLSAVAARSGRSVAEVIRDTVRKFVLKPQATGPVALWDGQPQRTAIEHDQI